MIVRLPVTSEEDLFPFDRMWDKVETIRCEISIIDDHIACSGDGNFIVAVKGWTDLCKEAADQWVNVMNRGSLRWMYTFVDRKENLEDQSYMEWSKGRNRTVRRRRWNEHGRNDCSRNRWSYFWRNSAQTNHACRKINSGTISNLRIDEFYFRGPDRMCRDANAFNISKGGWIPAEYGGIPSLGRTYRRSVIDKSIEFSHFIDMRPNRQLEIFFILEPIRLVHYPYATYRRRTLTTATNFISENPRITCTFCESVSIGRTDGRDCVSNLSYNSSWQV